MYIYIYTYVYVHMCVYIHIYICVNIYIYVMYAFLGSIFDSLTRKQYKLRKELLEGPGSPKQKQLLEAMALHEASKIPGSFSVHHGLAKAQTSITELLTI